MAIALDAARNMASGSGSSLTYAHTCTGDDRILFVFVETAEPTTDYVTSVTYNSVAMTRINTVTFTNGGSARVYLYYLIAPSTGSNNVVITSSSSIALIRGNAVSYTGASQTGQPDGNNTASGSGSSGTIAITTTADNCWMVFGQANNAAEPTAGSNATRRGTSGGGGFGYFDSNGAITPAALFTMGWAVGGGNGFGVCAASFSPATAAATTIKTVDGVTRANVKTRSGVASASIKTINDKT